jgi:hypothetical protein
VTPRKAKVRALDPLLLARFGGKVAAPKPLPDIGNVQALVKSLCVGPPPSQKGKQGRQRVYRHFSPFAPATSRLHRAEAFAFLFGSVLDRPPGLQQPRGPFPFFEKH